MGRESILNSIKQHKPALELIPEIDLNIFSEDINLLDTFINNVQLVGGNIKDLEHHNDFDSVIKELYPNAERIIADGSASNLGTVSITKKNRSTYS